VLIINKQGIWREQRGVWTKAINIKVIDDKRGAINVEKEYSCKICN
jgi:hypothetical protein